MMELNKGTKVELFVQFDEHRLDSLKAKVEAGSPRMRYGTNEVF